MPITWITFLLGSPGADRHAVLLGLLFQGQHHRSGGCQPSAGCRLCLLRGAGGRVRHGLLLVPPVLPGLPRQGALRHKPPDAHDHHDDDHGHGHGHDAKPHESPWVVCCRWCCWPFRRCVIGFATMMPDAVRRLLQGRIHVDAARHPPWPNGGRACHPWRLPHGAACLRHAAVLAGAGGRVATAYFILHDQARASRPPSAARWRRSTRCWRTSTTSTGSTRTCWLPWCPACWAPACGRAATGFADRRRAGQRLGQGGGPGWRASRAGSRPAMSITTHW
jgi:hypothetical protein